MQTIKIEFGGESVILTCNLAEASAPLLVDGESTPHQTSDARHRTDVAVLLAARHVWPETAWPKRPTHGSDEIETTDAWDDLSYKEAVDPEYSTSEQLAQIRAMAINDVTRAVMRDGIDLSHDDYDSLGNDVTAWMRDRLGLTITESNDGVECTPRG